MEMSIAALSVNMAQHQVNQKLDMLAMGKVFNQMQDTGDMVEELASAVDPNLGQNIDIQA